MYRIKVGGHQTGELNPVKVGIWTQSRFNG